MLEDAIRVHEENITLQKLIHSMEREKEEVLLFNSSFFIIFIFPTPTFLFF